MYQQILFLALFLPFVAAQFGSFFEQMFQGGGGGGQQHHQQHAQHSQQGGHGGVASQWVAHSEAGE